MRHRYTQEDLWHYKLQGIYLIVKEFTVSETEVSEARYAAQNVMECVGRQLCRCKVEFVNFRTLPFNLLHMLVLKTWEKHQRTECCIIQAQPFATYIDSCMQCFFLETEQ